MEEVVRRAREEEGGKGGGEGIGSWICGGISIGWCAYCGVAVVCRYAPAATANVDGRIHSWKSPLLSSPSSASPNNTPPPQACPVPSLSSP